MTKLLLTIFILLSSAASEARIEVAFLEAWTRSGKKVELEKGDRFAHVAIRYEGLWLHSAPANGTEIVAEFHVFYQTMITEILSDEEAADLTEEQVNALLGHPYDFKFRWSDDYGTYCSKLIGKLLSVTPVPMKFDGSYFEGIKNLPRGEPGLSPDGLHRELLRRGFVKLHPFHSFPRN